MFVQSITQVLHSYVMSNVHLYVLFGYNDTCGEYEELVVYISTCYWNEIKRICTYIIYTHT